MNKIKIFVIFFLCVILCGCRNKDDSIVLKFSTWGSASEMSIIKPITAEFERQNPNIKIKIMHIPQDYFKKLHLLFASNLAPDVLLINNLNIPQYSNFLVDLTEYVSKKDYYPQSIDGMSIDNSLYAIPRDVSTLVIYYNKSMFKKNNIAFPKDDWSMDDLLKTSKALTNNQHWGISFEPNVYYLNPFVNYYGGNITKNLEKNQKGIKLYKDLAYKYNIAPTISQVGSRTLAQMFLEEKIAMHISGRWLVPKYRECAEFDWDVINFPKWSASSDTSGWAVSKSTKHKKEAIKFILFLSNNKNISKMTKDGLIVPARYDVAKSKIFNLGKPQHSNVFTNSVEKSEATKVTKNYNKMIDVLNDKIFKL